MDTGIEAGSPWWTYKVENWHHTSDLVCMLPPSHYSDLSATFRTVVLVPKSDRCADIIEFPENIVNYATRVREMRPGSGVRSFLALCHGPKEEWSLVLFTWEHSTTMDN